jgi:hypothetical protein
MPFNRVAEMHGNTNMYLKRWRNNVRQQQFWFDEVTKTVRNNYWKNYCLEIAGKKESGNLKTSASIMSRWWQLFKVDGEFIVNEKGGVMDVQGGVDAENRNIIVHKKHGKVNQRWKIIYVDEYEKEPTKGQMNKKFGLIVDKDFYIVSKLSSHRYLDLINNRNMVIKTPNGRRTQIWYFHQPSLTIRTRYNNQSFDIKNSGKTNDMQIWSTNS